MSVGQVVVAVAVMVAVAVATAVATSTVSAEAYEVVINTTIAALGAHLLAAAKMIS